MAKSLVNMQVVRSLRGFLAVEALAYAVAAVMHLGAIHPMERDPWAGGAELLITAVLIAGFIGIGRQPTRAIRCAIQAQLFALGVTLLGMFIVVMTLTSDTVPALIFHISITIVVTSGLAYALSRRTGRK